MNKNSSLAMKKVWRNAKIRKKIISGMHRVHSKHSKTMLEHWKKDGKKQHMSKHMIKRWRNQQYKIKTSASIKKALNKPIIKAKRIASLKKSCNTVSFFNKVSRIRKQIWQRPEYRKKISVVRQKQGRKLENIKALLKIRKRMAISPNQFEKRIIKIITLNQLPYKFVGNGKFILAGKNPDFVHTKEKIVAEAYEDYWKSQNGMTPARYVRERRKIFAKEGYQTVFIHIRDSPDTVLEKLIGVC